MINKYYYIILSFFLTRVLFLGGGYTVLLNIGKNSSILCGILGMLLGYFILYLLYKKKQINEMVCVLISIGVLLINILSNTILTSTYLLYKTPTLIIMGLFLGVIWWASKKDFKIIYRFALVSICLSIPILGLVYFGLFPIGEIDNLKPFLDTKWLDLVKGILFFMVNSILPNILLLNYKKDLKYKDVGIGYIFGCLTTIYLTYLIISIYGIEMATVIRFPEYLILKKFTFLNYVSNVENILIMVWIFNLLISGWICLKVLRDNWDRKILFIFIILFFLGIEFFLNKNYVNVLLIRNNIHIVWGILLILCLVLKKKKS